MGVCRLTGEDGRWGGGNLCGCGVIPGGGTGGIFGIGLVGWYVDELVEVAAAPFEVCGWGVFCVWEVWRLDGVGKSMVRLAERVRSLTWDLGEAMIFIRMGEKGMEVSERDTSAVLRGAFCPQPAHLTVIICTSVVSGGDVVGEV